MNKIPERAFFAFASAVNGVLWAAVAHKYHQPGYMKVAWIFLGIAVVVYLSAVASAYINRYKGERP